MKVLITGATGGIGEAIAYRLQQEDCDLLLQGRNRIKLQSLSAGLKTRTNQVAVCVADINKASDRTALVEQAKRFGVDVLINNAGVNDFRPFSDTDIAAIIQTNVTSTMLLTQQLLPILLSQGQPKILNVGSTFSSIGYPGYVAYCASKHAIKGFTEALRREYADTSLNVLYVAPRATTTEMNSAAATRLNERLGVHADAPDTVAKTVWSALANNKARSALGLKEKLQSKINSLFPSVVDNAIKAQLPTIKQFLDAPQEQSHEKIIANTSA